MSRRRILQSRLFFFLDSVVAMNADEGECARSAMPGARQLSAVLGFAEAKELHESLKVALHEPELTLDASDVDRMSTPCVQVLLAAGRLADSEGRRFTIKNASQSFLAALEDFGLRSTFSKWVA